MWKELPQEHINKAVAVASPGLVSTEAASDGVTLFLTTVFLVIALWKVMSFFSSHLFPRRLSRVLSKFSHKKIIQISSGTVPRVENFVKRLTAYMAASGGHFEHLQ